MVILAAASGQVRLIASWGIRPTWRGTQRWRLRALEDARGWSRTSSLPSWTKFSLKDANVEVVEGLEEGEELLGSVDISPEEIARFFELPT